MRRNAVIIALIAVMVSIGGRQAAAQQSADDPRLDTRVSISYHDAPATDVLVALARAGDLRMILTVAPLQPVTVTLTNVKLRTALDAICQTAGCAWQLTRNENAAPEFRDMPFLRITALDDPLPPLPKTVSLTMSKAPVSSVFRALAAAINVALILETDLSAGPLVRYRREPSTWNLADANITGVLNLLCEIGNCSWELNEKNRTLRVFARKP